MRRALFISTFFYFPFDNQAVHGVFRRMDIHLQALCEMADEVDLLFLMPAGQHYSEAEVRAHESRLRMRWSSKIRLYMESVVAPQRRQGRLDFIRAIFDFKAQVLPSFPQGIHCEAARQAVLRALERSPDIIFAHRLGVMSLLASLPRAAFTSPVYFDIDDIEHRAHARRVWTTPDWPMQRLHILHVPAIVLAERRAARRAVATLVCSEEDRRHMQRVTGVRSFEIVRNAVPIPPLNPDAAQTPTAVFVGMLSYRPNAEAADLLVREVWPRVRARVPQARLNIVGKRPESVRSYKNPGEGVSFLGFVDDIEAVYRDARLVCCPILVGSGTRVKIIEAAAYSRAVVSTPIGAEGLEFEDGREILLPQDLDAFVGACVRLLQSPHTAEQIGMAAYRKARALYGREAVAESLVAVLRNGAPAGMRAHVA